MNQQLKKTVAAVAAHRRPIVVTAFLLSFAIAFTTVATASSPVIRQIDIFDAGSAVTVQSISADPADVLASAGIETSPKDIVDVSRFADDAAPSITIYRYCTVAVSDDGSIEQVGAAGFVADALESAGIVLTKGDVVSPAPDEPLAPGMEIMISRAFPVTVKADGKTIKLAMADGTVAEALAIAGVHLGAADIVKPGLSETLTEGTAVRVYRIVLKMRTVTERTRYKTVTKYTADLYKGSSKTLQRGSDGKSEVTYTDRYVDGKLYSSAVKSSKVLVAPVSKIVLAGTKVRPSTIRFNGGLSPMSPLTPPASVVFDENGMPKNYKRIIEGIGTAYSGGQSTATGRRAAVGYVAVNPRIIPYGTRLYIVSTDGRYNYGYCIAADTGGFIYWNNAPVVDLFMNSESQCEAFGRRQVRIYVLG